MLRSVLFLLMLLLLPVLAFGQATIPDEYLKPSPAAKPKPAPAPKPASQEGAGKSAADCEREANGLNLVGGKRAEFVRTCLSGGKGKSAPSGPSTSIRAGSTFTDPTTGMEFVKVPGGTFEMGCGAWSSDCGDNEKPVHTVTLDGFLIGKYEVTQGQWKKVMGSNPSKFQNGDSYPVENVSWDDAQKFIQKLNAMGGGGTYRLPTEAEWEYACRSGGKAEKFCGGNNLDSAAWYDGNSGKSTHPVGTKAPNGLGIYDMSGNVWEWVGDVYSATAYSSHQRKNPMHSDGGGQRVLRGGSWYYFPKYLRSSNRYGNTEYNNSSGYGFRLARVGTGQ